MYSPSCAVVGLMMCCALAASAIAESGDEPSKAPARSVVSPSPENDAKAEDLLRTTVKARQTQVYALLDQFKATYGVAWQFDKAVRDGYGKLETDRLGGEELSTLSQSILQTLVALPYRHPLEDKELLRAVGGMCFHTKEGISNSFMRWLSRFAEAPEDSTVEDLLSVLTSNPQGRPIMDIPVSPAVREKYRALYQGLVDSEKREYEKHVKAGKATVYSEIIRLSRRAQLGDEASSQKLIALYGQLKWDGEDAGHAARLAMGQLLVIGTRDCIVAVLQRFRENVGSPEYRPGTSPRADILESLMWKCPNDAFFEPYRDYLAGPHNYTVLDSAIGGTAGVEKLYAGLQAWVQKRYDYKLNLDGAEPKIKATPPVRKYFAK